MGEGGNMLHLIQASAAEAERSERYLSWQELRYRKPPEGLSSEQWWQGIKLHRMQARSVLPLKAANGTGFSYASTGLIQAKVREIDLKGGGMVMMDTPTVFLPEEREF